MASRKPDRGSWPSRQTPVTQGISAPVLVSYPQAVTVVSTATTVWLVRNRILSLLGAIEHDFGSRNSSRRCTASLQANQGQEGNFLHCRSHRRR